MSLSWSMGADRESGKESTFNSERANKWTNSIIPTQGMIIRLSGSGNHITSQLSSSTLYILIGKVDMHIVSGDNSVIATTASLFWPALTPIYFIPDEEKSYISVVSSISGTAVDAYVSVIEQS